MQKLTPEEFEAWKQTQLRQRQQASSEVLLMRKCAVCACAARGELCQDIHGDMEAQPYASTNNNDMHRLSSQRRVNDKRLLLLAQHH